MSLLSKALKHPLKSLGNLAKDASPLLAFTPAGVVGAGGLALAGGLARGEKLGKAVKSGISNAAIGGTGASLAGKVGLGTGAHLGFGLGGGSSVPPVTRGGVPISANDISGTLSDGTGTAGAVVDTPSSPSLMGGLAGAGGKVLSFAEKNPTATGLALNAAGGLATAGSENRLRDAQAANLEQQAGETAYDFAQRKRREALLAPIWSSLGTHVGSGFPSIAPNPYAPAVA